MSLVEANDFLLCNIISLTGFNSVKTILSYLTKAYV